MSVGLKLRLPVMEHFHTLQGEGRWAGTAAYFVRLAGCDVGCHWCDVKESWPISDEQWMDVDAIVALAGASGAPLCVVTGGEPAMHNLDGLTAALRASGMRTHIETSGAHPPSGAWDWVTLSPKKFKEALPEWYALAHELKVVVYNAHDLEWAEGLAARVDRARTGLVLQPEWSRRDRVHAIIDYIKAHPWWTLGLQTHKYVDIP